MKSHLSFLAAAFAAGFILLNSPASIADDVVEFLNGSKVSGVVKQIRKSDKEFDFVTKVGSRSFSRTYAFREVHAVTFKGKRYELSPKPDADSGGSASAEAEMQQATRTKVEVKEGIETAGTTPPDWFDSTPLYYPKTLDLSWPLKPATKGWNTKKNMVHYLYSEIQENPSRYHSGIKLVHHCMAMHESNRTLLKRDMQRLGGLYFELLKDYPRAAFWYQKVNPPVSQMGGIHLAECYWRLGNRDMALDMLRGNRLHYGAIKVLGEMGEIEMATRVANAYSKTNASSEAFLLCGDALRLAGNTEDAIAYYQRVLDSTRFRNKEYQDRFKGRARDSIEAIRVFDQLDVSKLVDGTYRESAIGYAGRVNVEALVRSGRINSVKVTTHKEKRHYNALTDIPDKIVDGQTVQGIDGTSGATVTSQAIVNATAKALAQGTASR